jgi:hypothetical protein
LSSEIHHAEVRVHRRVDRCSLTELGRAISRAEGRAEAAGVIVLELNEGNYAS